MRIRIPHLAFAASDDTGGADSDPPSGADHPFEATDTYIPTPREDGSCDPHIKAAGEGWYWVVCEDCSTELVEGKDPALARLGACGS